jgi:hypothetical protein
MPENQPNTPAPEQFRLLRGSAVMAVLIGFLAGVVLYLPWDTIWDFGLRRLAARMPGVQLRWQGVDRAGPLGFRVNGLSAEAPGWPFSPRLDSLELRLGVSPRLTLRADTGGAVLRAVVLDTGDFDVSGTAALGCLGRRDISGNVDVRCEGLVQSDRGALEKAFLDLRGTTLKLPGGLLLGDAVLAVEYREDTLRIRSFSLRAPVQIRAEGTAAVRIGRLLDSPYSVSGEILRGRDSLPFSAQGRLGDFLGETALP